MDTGKLKCYPRSKVWDERTQQLVDAIRTFINRDPPPTISHIQNESVKARPLKGAFTSLRDVIQAPPEDDVRQLLFNAISELGDADYEPPLLAHVPVEWTLDDSSLVTPEKPVSLTSQSRIEDSGLTILHVHGGAYL